MTALAIVMCLVCSIAGGLAAGAIGSLIVLDSFARHAPGNSREHEYRATTTKPS